MNSEKTLALEIRGDCLLSFKPPFGTIFPSFHTILAPALDLNLIRKFKNQNNGK